MLLDRLLEHPNPKVRIGSLTLFGLLGDHTVSDRLLRLVHEENNRDVKRTALRTASRLGIPLPDSLARELLGSDSDWVVQSYALRELSDMVACFFVSDGTEFATDIESMAREAGFHVVTLTTSPGSPEFSDFQEGLLSAYSMVAVIRGEHFAQYGNEEFYKQIRRFVIGGGTLFATSWVSWETKYHYEFAEVLPFQHIRDTYDEDVRVICNPTDESFSRHLLAESISYRTSMELLERKEGSTVLLEGRNSVPILGYRAFASGVCYYFNTCQHSCFSSMESPLRTNSELATAVGKLLTRIRVQALEHWKKG